MLSAQEPGSTGDDQSQNGADMQSVSGRSNESEKADNAEPSVEELKARLNGLEESYLETKSNVDKLKKFKISGYLQAQFRTVVDPDTIAMKDTSAANEFGEGAFSGKYKYAVGDFAGGKFADGSRNLFQIRRARLKVAYEADLTQCVVQFDVLPFTVGNVVTSANATGATATAAFFNGSGVTIKDFYLRFAEPWLKSFAVKAGIYDRPFGYEISYSSSMRESPERSRIFQTLFPEERDMGISLEYLAADNLPAWAQYINLKAGAFAGNGINIENDNNRDIIGRLGLSLPFNDINLAIDGGFSGYVGKVTSLNDTIAEYDADAKKFVKETGYKNKNLDRKYLGGDLQLYYDLPVIGGICLRGEFIKALAQPGVSDNNGSPKSNIANSKPTYMRVCNGFYGMVVQNINPINSQLVFKYDVFDPNIDVEEDEINLASGLKAADVKFSTLGFGVVYHWDENVKFIAYYDRVMNELVNEDFIHDATMKYYTEDLQDDVFTFRIQYKF
jgi:hypothetical protein